MNEAEIKLKGFQPSHGRFMLSLMREIGTIEEDYYRTAMEHCSPYELYQAVTTRSPSSIFYVICKDENTPIGAVELEMSLRHNRAQVTVYIMEKYRSPSYALKVWESVCRIANTSHIHKLLMEVASWNDPVVKALRKVPDVTEEAVLRDHIKKDGKYYDTHVFAKFFEAVN